MFRLSMTWKLTCALAVVGLFGCASKPSSLPPSRPAAGTASDTTSPSDSGSSQKPASDANARKPGSGSDLPGDPAEIASKYLRDAFFEFDRFDLRERDRNDLAANAEFLQKHLSITISIEGHCDERGTREYNLSLGEKRAHTVREYLESLGVAPSRISVISYGKERPFATGRDEQSWAKNRRAHFVVTAK